MRRYVRRVAEDGEGQQLKNGPAKAQQRLRRMVLDALPARTPAATTRKRSTIRPLLHGPALSRELLMEYLASIDRCLPRPSMSDCQPTRKMVSEARRNGMVSAEQAANFSEFPSIRPKGTRLGNWLTREQAKELLTMPRPLEAQRQA